MWSWMKSKLCSYWKVLYVRRMTDVIITFMKWTVKGPWTYSSSLPKTSNGRWGTLTNTLHTLKSWNSTSRRNFAYVVVCTCQTKLLREPCHSLSHNHHRRHNSKIYEYLTKPRNQIKGTKIWDANQLAKLGLDFRRQNYHVKTLIYWDNILYYHLVLCQVHIHHNFIYYDLCVA